MYIGNVSCVISALMVPDSVMFRASASEVGGAGLIPCCVIPKTLKMVPVACLALSIHKASTGFSSLKKITPMMGIQ